MKEIQRGFRGKIEDFFDVSKEITVSISIVGAGDCDSCCFGVDSNDKLSDESYMIFFNQTSSPKSEIVLNGSGADTSYTVGLSKLPDNIYKLVFTLSIDGDGVMGRIQKLTVQISQGGNTLNLNMTGADFRDEKAVIAVELYKKDIWRVSAVASGFNGGMSALLKHFGGEEAASAPTAPAVPVADTPSAAPSKISLEKHLEKEAPQLVSLAKPLKLSLEKHKLTETIARVGLVLDISGSMSLRYKNGVVQEIVNRTVPLAVQFDDDGELDLWYYGTRTQQMPSVNTGNYQTAVPSDWKKFMAKLG